MAETSPAYAAVDRNLLFGGLALQRHFITEAQLIASLLLWKQDRTQPLGEVLVRQKALSAGRREALEELVREQLEHYHNDPAQLSTVHASVDAVDKLLRQMAEPEPEANAATLTSAPPPAPEAGITQVWNAGSPTALGAQRFRVLRPHARGGLGQVSVAHDAELGREVALKEILERCADDVNSRARFLQEAEITGNLEHPGVVPVYALGQYADGRPYYAMRFIQGQSLRQAITQFYQEEGPARDSGRRAVAFRGLLSRFVAVCNVMEYAHSRRVLHRDLKPSNIMLGKYGETLVVDWGLAKALGTPERALPTSERTLMPASASGVQATQMGSALGTPSYMSPEQAAGRLDLLGPPADIYSLGATLYCLLTGTAPVEGVDAGEMLLQVQSGNFPRPRQRRPGVPAALEAICLKAMARRPEERYPSARALADDVEKWLADEPVAVYREPLPKRLRRWARRHRAALAGLGGLVLMAVVALAVGTVLIWQEQERTEKQRQQADANFQTALQAVNDMLTEVAQEQLVDEPRMEIKRRVLLEKAKTYFDRFLEQRGDDPALRTEAALAHKRLGDIAKRLGQHPAAVTAYEQALALLQALAEERPGEPELRRALAESYTNLGEVQRLRSLMPDAARAYHRGRDLALQLVKDFPEHAGYRKDLARAHYNLGILHKDLNEPREAQEAFTRALGLLSDLVTEQRGVAEYRKHLARVYLNLGPVLRARGDSREAERLYGEALRLQQELLAKDERNPEYRYELGVTCNNLGFLQQAEKSYDKAGDSYRRALDQFERLVSLYPAVPVYRKELANTQNNLAIVLARKPDWEGARAAWRQARQRFADLAAEYADVPEYQGSQAMVIGNLGWLELKLENYPPAREYLREGIAKMTAALARNPLEPTQRRVLREQHEYLADTYLKEKNPAEAAAVALALSRVQPELSEDLGSAAVILGRCAALVPAARALSYADAALALLQQAAQRGELRRDTLANEAFQVLRERAEFKKLQVRQ